MILVFIELPIKWYTILAFLTPNFKFVQYIYVGVLLAASADMPYTK